MFIVKCLSTVLCYKPQKSTCDPHGRTVSPHDGLFAFVGQRHWRLWTSLTETALWPQVLLSISVCCLHPVFLPSLLTEAGACTARYDASSFPRLPSYSPTQISSLIRPCMFQLTLASDLDQVESNPKRLFISCFDLFLGHGAGWTREFCLVSAHCTSCKQAKVVPGQERRRPGWKASFKEDPLG